MKPRSRSVPVKPVRGVHTCPNCFAVYLASVEDEVKGLLRAARRFDMGLRWAKEQGQDPTKPNYAMACKAGASWCRSEASRLRKVGR